MWTHPGWHLWAGAQPPPRQPGRTEVVMARVRHPSFTPDQLDDLLHGLSRRQLRRLWRESAAALETEMGDDIRFHVVLLREQLLDRLDQLNRSGS